VTRRAVGDEIVQPELVGEDDPGVRPGRGDARVLKLAGQDEGLAVALDEEERIDDLQRQLVAHRGMPRRVAVQEDRRHRVRNLRDLGARLGSRAERP
jgi:hypothetical protein